MAGISLDQAQARLDAWLAADAAVAQGQSYSGLGRTLTRADAATIRDNIQFWERKVLELTSNSGGGRGRRVRYGVTDS